MKIERTVTDEPVPLIRIEGRTVYSESQTPVDITDTCACFTERGRAFAKRLLLGTEPIICRDMTAYAAMLAMSLDKMYRGRRVLTIRKLVKAWESGTVQAETR